MEMPLPSPVHPPAPEPNGVALRVVPNARKTEVVGLHGDAIRLKVASPALEGKANAAILEFVAGHVGVPVRAVVLVAGAKSRDKVVRVEGMRGFILREKLLAASGGKPE
jgi:hypothetical protein